jgi:hypothetical protein
MEGSAGEAEAAYRCRYFYLCEASPMSTAHFLPPTTYPPHPIHIFIILGMGRHSWATPDQLVFLKSWVPQLPRAKETIGLQTLYLQVHESFLEKWKLESVGPVAGMSPEQITAKAKNDLLKVRTKFSFFLYTHNLPAHHKLVQGGTKEGEATSPLSTRDDASYPRPIRQVEA